MFDSVTATDIPRGADLVAGYITGRYKWSLADWALFPPSSHVLISTTAEYALALVLDIEAGDALPQQAAAWARSAGPASGWLPTLYGSRVSLGEARHYLEIAGVAADYWLADWTGVEHLPAGFAVCQYAAPGHGSPGHYDISCAEAGWPHPFAAR